MKRAILVALLIACPVIASAQAKKGDVIIGTGLGSVSGTSSTSTTTYTNTPTEYKSTGTSFSISLNPYMGWCLQDNLAVGASVSVSYYTSESKSSNTSSTTTSTSDYAQPSFYLGPFARYYFGSGDKGRTFVHVNAQYGIATGDSKSETSTGASSKTTYKPKGDWNAGVAVGYEAFLSQWVGLYGSVGVNYGSSKTTYEYRPSTSAGYDYTSEYTRTYYPVNVGIQVHLPGGRK